MCTENRGYVHLSRLHCQGFCFKLLTHLLTVRDNFLSAQLNKLPVQLCCKMSVFVRVCKMKLKCTRTVSVCMPVWIMDWLSLCVIMVNESDGRCSSCLTCDQSSHCLISQFLSVHYFLEMLEYFFLDAKKLMFIFVLHCFTQIYISLSIY